MRTDAAIILIGMGYASTDFLAYEDGAKGVQITWLAKSPKPTEAEIEAAAPAALAALQAKETQKVESDTARTEAKQAYSELQPLIEHKDPAISLLAAIMQKHLLATLGR